MNRRGFLGSILATCSAPAFVRYGSLMVPKQIAAQGTGLANSGFVTSTRLIWNWNDVTMDNAISDFFDQYRVVPTTITFNSPSEHTLDT